MITSWLHSYDLLIVATLSAIYISTAVAIHWLCFRPATRALVMSFDGAVTPFIGFSTTIFALTSAFLGASVWQNFQANADAIKHESKTMALALGIATISIVVMLGLIALSIETHTGMISVSNQPMDQILQQFSANLR